MYVLSRLQLTVIAVAALPAWASAQSSALSRATGNGPTQAVQLSPGPIVAPLEAQPGPATASLPADVIPAPSAQLEAEPIPTNVTASVPTPTPTPTPETLGGPSLGAATAGIHAYTDKENLSSQQLADRAAHHGGFGTDGALMIVGGAAFIAGLIIGGGAGTAIAIGGAVIGLYGLYLYLQ